MLNEKISNWFEPKPPIPPWKESTARLMLHVINPDSWKGTQSEKRYWLWDDVRWQPLDYDTDEAANARLLEAMPRVSLYHTAHFWECSFRGDNLIRTAINHSDRLIAVRMAFVKFAGIPGEGE